MTGFRGFSVSPLLPETPAVLRVRQAVRAWLTNHHEPGASICVALSGGADSLALTAATVVESAGPVRALVVDHQLQPGSDVVARSACKYALDLGCTDADVLPVTVAGAGGLEAAARESRYRALNCARAGAPVLLGHTLDDQAETVLLGLSRGSGARSLAGMAPYDSPWGRPLLVVRRADTTQMCADLQLSPFRDPHNFDATFRRVRVRHEVLPLMEEALGGGVAAALARTAAHLRADNEALDALAAERFAAARRGAELDTDAVARELVAVRIRLVRTWLATLGVTGLQSRQFDAIDGLIVDWRGQGGVAVPGGASGVRLVVQRRHGRLTLGAEQSGEQLNQVPGGLTEG